MRRVEPRLIVILTTNDMSIAPPVGACRYLSRLYSGRPIARWPEAPRQINKRSEDLATAQPRRGYSRGS